MHVGVVSLNSLCSFLLLLLKDFNPLLDFVEMFLEGDNCLIVFVQSISHAVVDLSLVVKERGL